MTPAEISWLSGVAVGFVLGWLASPTIDLLVLGPLARFLGRFRSARRFLSGGR